MRDRMSRGDQIAAGGALALVVSLFLPWYGIDFGGQLGNDAFAKLIEQEASGLSAFKAFEVIDIILLLIGVAVAAVVFLMANGNLDGSLRRIIETAGSFAALAIVFRMVDQPDPSQFVKLRYGIVVGLLAAVAISVGGMLNRREGMGGPRRTPTDPPSGQTPGPGRGACRHDGPAPDVQVPGDSRQRCRG